MDVFWHPGKIPGRWVLIMDGSPESSNFSPATTTISVVIPVHNEVGNVAALQKELVPVLESLSMPWEICFVDDGSTDGTSLLLDQISHTFPNTRVIHLTRKFGQSAAIQAGLDHTHGEIVVTMDGDLQNDPHDIPHLIETLQKGYDIVHGWRRHRHDHWLTRRVPSLMANWLIRKITGVEIPDLGCAIRVMRRWVADCLELLGDAHRYLPIFAHSLGAKSTVVVVNHRPRQSGKSKYGLSRLFRVLCDIPVVLFLTRFRSRPMRFLVTLGVINAMLVATALLLSLLTLQSHSLTILAIVLATWAITTGGITTLGLGLVAELLERAGTNRHPAYIVRYMSGIEHESAVIPLSRENFRSIPSHAPVKRTGT